MFSFLRFDMENAMGIPVKVEINHKAGLLSYAIEFGAIVDPDANWDTNSDAPLAAKGTKFRTMSKGDSDRFIRRWRKVSCNDMMREMATFQGALGDDHWHLLLKYEDVDARLSGPKPGTSLFDSFIEPLTELLDDTFGVTQFVKASRVDRLEIEMFEPVVFSEEFSFMEDASECSHAEHVSLSRGDWTLAYSRMFPHGCFHNSYECHCEGEIRQILDQTSEILENGDLLQGNVEEEEGPLLTFTFHFHDGNQAMVNRTLSKDGTGSQVYDEMLEVIGQTIGCTVFAGGMFDPNRNDSSEKVSPDPSLSVDRYMGR